MKKLVCIILAIIIICASATVGFAAEIPDCKVSLVASHISAKAGDEIKVSLIFENAADYPYGLAAFCASLSYDSNAVKLESIKSAALRTDVTTSSKLGLAKTLYIFASATKQPGFNKNSAFLTATFTVLDSNVDIADFSVTFDAITVSEYTADNKVNNYQVPFNSPKASIDIIGNESPVAASSSAASSNIATESAASSAAPVESAPESVKNDDFIDVEKDNNDKISVDTVDDSGNISSETEIVNPTESRSESDLTASEPFNPIPKGNDKLFIVVMSIFAATVIGAVVAVIIIIIRKNKH